ncbi:MULTISPECIES: phage tail protein [unclassified Pseudomonas]|uniref:phage tail protein n=1 Tax=unclassified Pseudomonas TaxID=196821 RepID=UPI0003571E45|nr:MULTISPECIES: phage tail protein [unclassified Pseudomonas]EPJ83234.1 putative tail fiber protein H [Pseudomonas sp. CFT9]
MVDVNTQFGGFLTTQGAAKKTNCDALGVPWKLTHMLLGDANGADPVPAPGQTQLVHQVHRAPLNQLYASPTDPNVLIAELVLPPDVGGWWIRELALEDEAGVFSAVANCAPSYKPLLAQNSGRNQVVRMHILTSSTANIQLKIDPSVVLATREYVDKSLLAVLPDNKLAGTYRQVTIDKRGVVQSGSNPTTLDGFGIKDAIPNKNPLPSGSLDIHGDYYAFLTSPLESSVAQNCYWNGTAWYRHDISQPAVCITLDDGRFSVRRVGAGQNPIVWQTMSPVWDASNAKFSGLLERPTTLSGYSIGDAFTKAETTANIEAAIARLIGSAPGAVDTIEELARALNNNPNFATDIINGLASKADKATTLAGYGIKNGLVDKNPLPGGSVDIHGDVYAFLTSPLESSVCQNCYWNGTAWYRHQLDQPAVSVTVSGGGALVRTAPAGAGPIVWASTEPLWTSKNATVTSSGGTGTLKLPNGWVQQIFEVTESTSASDVRYFPVSFPNECFGVFPVLLSSTSGGYGTNVGVVVGDVTKDRFLINAGGSFSGEGRFRVLALGR